jgi:hypothetical protein
MSPDRSITPETDFINRLLQAIGEVPNGLDPRILAFWYHRIEKLAKETCPSKELKESIRVIQNPELPMKFEFKCSERAASYVLKAVEKTMNEMPFATRMYFQKFLEIMQSKMKSAGASNKKRGRLSRLKGAVKI